MVREGESFSLPADLTLETRPERRLAGLNPFVDCGSLGRKISRSLSGVAPE